MMTVETTGGALETLPTDEAPFRAVWEAATDAMALSDADGIVVAANPAYFDLYGYSPDEIIGQSFAIIFPPAERAAAEEAYRQFFAEGVHTEGVESTVQRRDGTVRQVDVRYNFIEIDGRRVVMLSAIRDVTDRVQLRDAERELNKQKDDFLLAVSHDLRTPVTGILGYAQLLQRRLKREGAALDPDALLQGLERIEQTAARMNRLIGELLEATTVGPGEDIPLRCAPVDLNGIVRRVTAMLQQAAPLHQIEVQVPEEPLVGAWDADRIERVIENLVSNAVKYSPDGGRVEIAARRDGDDAVLAVTDEGMGIPEADLPRIFERFYRSGAAERGITGFGIGLSAVKRIVERHGGTISVQSREGEGSTFTVRLPLSVEAVAEGS